MKTFLIITKNILLFIALWIFTYFLVDALTNYDFSEGFIILIQSLAVAVLIAFVWKKVAKKYLEK